MLLSGLCSTPCSSCQWSLRQHVWARTQNKSLFCFVFCDKQKSKHWKCFDPVCVHFSFFLQMQKANRYNRDKNETLILFLFFLLLLAERANSSSAFHCGAICCLESRASKGNEGIKETERINVLPDGRRLTTLYLLRSLGSKQPPLHFLIKWPSSHVCTSIFKGKRDSPIHCNCKTGSMCISLLFEVT